MIVVKNADGQIVFSAGTPEDTQQKAEQYAKKIGGTIETVHFEEAEKLAAEQAAIVIEKTAVSNSVDNTSKGKNR